MLKPPDDLVRELVQVASVAVAAIEQFRGISFNAVSRLVFEERIRQEVKWGPQLHDPRTWMTILGEEFGEACQEALRMTHQDVLKADTNE